MIEAVRAFSPATVTNLSCGFDILGLALEHPGDEVIIRRREKKGIEIIEISGDDGRLPRELMRNTCGRAVAAMAENLHFDGGLEIRLHKKMALGTGMGSSAASSVVGVFALDALLETHLDRHSLLKYALEGEKLTSAGKVHADNVAASLFGGISLVRSVEPLHVIDLNIPAGLTAAVIHPHVELNTEDMRKVLPLKILLAKAVAQWGNIAALIAGFERNDPELIRLSMQDNIVEPLRSRYIPHFDEIKALASRCGALGAGISGSGPSIFSLWDRGDKAEEFASEAVARYRKNEYEADVTISGINRQGPRILEIIRDDNKI